MTVSAVSLDGAKGEAAQEFAVAQCKPFKITGRGPLNKVMADLPTGGLSHVTDVASGTLPVDPAAAPGQPLRTAGTAKDALPAGLGDTPLPGPLNGGGLGGLSGMYGGLPGLSGVMPANTLHQLPRTPVPG
jgi:hypothetical protein